jgi:cytoskeleton protein RodZ
VVREVTPREAPSIVGAVTSPYRLVARASESTWVRVRTEDGRAIEDTIPAGESREWISNTPFTVTVGNAGGVALELNGEKLPPLGARGVVVPRLVLPPPQQ